MDHPARTIAHVDCVSAEKGSIGAVLRVLFHNLVEDELVVQGTDVLACRQRELKTAGQHHVLVN